SSQRILPFANLGEETRSVTVFPANVSYSTDSWASWGAFVQIDYFPETGTIAKSRPQARPRGRAGFPRARPEKRAVRRPLDPDLASFCLRAAVPSSRRVAKPGHHRVRRCRRCWCSAEAVAQTQPRVPLLTSSLATLKVKIIILRILDLPALRK